MDKKKKLKDAQAFKVKGNNLAMIQWLKTIGESNGLSTLCFLNIFISWKSFISLNHR